MQTLNLEPPQRKYLEANCQPTLAKLDTAIGELQAARHAFSGTNDNRTLISKLAEQVRVQAEDLMFVFDADLTAVNASLAWREMRTTLLSIGREITAAAGIIASDDPAVQFPLKRFRQSVKQLVELTNGFGEGNDTRPAIVTAVTEVRARWADVLAMESAFDAWAPNRLSAACKQLLAAIAQPIQLTPESSPEPRPFNHLRQRLHDAISDARSLMGHVGNSAKEGKSQREAILASVKSVSDLIASDWFAPLENAQLQEIRERLAQIRRDLHALPRIPAIAVTPLRPLIAESLQGIDLYLDRVTALIPAASSTTPRAETFLGRIREGFGWNDESPEAA